MNESEKNKIIEILQTKFNQNSQLHPATKWENVEVKLTENVLSIINRMEETGGEPDLIVMPDGRMAYAYCWIELDKERKSLCYDKEAWEKRKHHKPIGNVVNAAKEIGSSLINEDEYFHLQSLDNFDLKGQTWLKTSEDFRKTGNAFFANKRYDKTFVYYNGVESYYSNRGFRSILYLD